MGLMLGIVLGEALAFSTVSSGSFARQKGQRAMARSFELSAEMSILLMISGGDAYRWDMINEQIADIVDLVEEVVDAIVEVDIAWICGSSLIL